MTAKNKRRKKRIENFNLLSYTCRNLKGEDETQGIGRTLNISQSGVLMETDQALTPDFSILIDVGLEDKLINAQGKVVYCRKSQNAQFEIGIQFVKMTRNAIDTLGEYIQLFRDKNLQFVTTLSVYSEDLSNTVFAIAGEHRIISKHIIDLKKVIEDPDPTVTPVQVQIILDALQKDLKKHVIKADDILFAGALLSNPSVNIKRMIDNLKKEHDVIVQEISKLKIKVKRYLDKRLAFDSKIINILNTFIEYVKKHIKTEIVSLYPALDRNPECLMLIKDFANRYGRPNI